VLRLVRGLALSCHPGPCVAVTAFATALAVAIGISAGRCVLVAAAVLSGQLSIGWLNDYVDRDLDRAAARTDKPLSLGLVSADAVRAALVVAAAACVVLSLALGWRAAVIHLLTVGSAYSYDLWLKPTLWSPAPFAVSFGLLPAVVTLALPHHPWPDPAVLVAGAALGLAAHLANTVGDTEADALTGVQGFPQRLGPRGSLIGCVGLIAVAGIAVVVVAPHAWAPRICAAVAVGAVLVALARPGRLAFGAAVLAAGLVVVGLVSSGAAITG
jgi:4-hydroxybenzoate polyprenyltransferase